MPASSDNASPLHPVPNHGSWERVPLLHATPSRRTSTAAPRMASAGRRRRFPVRPAWIRRRPCPKQRGVKLRSSGSESDGNPHPVVQPVRRDGVAVSKVALKVGVGGDSGMRPPNLASGSHDVGSKRVVVVRDGGDGGICGTNTGTRSRDGSPKDIMEVGGGGGDDDGDDDVNYPPMLGCCSCNETRKHLVAEEGGCEGACPRNLGRCDWCGSPKHGGLGRLRPKYAGRSRLRRDDKGQLYVLDTEAEDSDLEESCRPVLRRRLAATGDVALETGSTKGTIDDSEMTEEMKQYMEQCLAGIEEANREVFIPWIKVFLFIVLLRKIQIKGMAMNWCIITEARTAVEIWQLLPSILWWCIQIHKELSHVSIR